jgi:transcriptional regulator with XRE-family HTH domain
VPRRKTRSEVGARFGATLRKIRRSRRLSQESLAELAGVTADYLGFVERGENVPTVVMMLRLARALGVDPAALLADIDPNALSEAE